MAGEVLLINPRRRRRRRKARTHARKRTHRRRRHVLAMNPRRRRRRVGRRHSRRARAHRNPRIPFLGSVNVTGIVAGGAGYIGTRYGTGWALSLLPPQWSADPNTAPMVRIGVKALVGLFGLPMLAKALRIKGAAHALALGGGIAVAVDIFETYLAKMIPIPMADYEQGYITAYEPGQITGIDDPTDVVDVDAYGGGAYGS